MGHKQEQMDLLLLEFSKGMTCSALIPCAPLSFFAIPRSCASMLYMLLSLSRNLTDLFNVLAFGWTSVDSESGSCFVRFFRIWVYPFVQFLLLKCCHSFQYPLERYKKQENGKYY